MFTSDGDAGLWYGHMVKSKSGVESFKDLIAWQKAFGLAIRIHRSTEGFPREERYGIASELRRTSRSIPYNIAEGHQRHTTREFVRFLDIALGSQAELETQILFANRLGHFDPETGHALIGLCGEVGKIIRGLSASLLAGPNTDPRRASFRNSVPGRDSD